MNIYNHETPLHKITPPHPLYICIYIYKKREIKALNEKKKKGIIVYSQGHSEDCGSVLKQTLPKKAL